MWVGGASVLCALMIAFTVAVTADWARCSHPTSDLDRQTCGVGEHATLLGIVGLSLVVTLGVGIVAGSVVLTRRPR